MDLRRLRAGEWIAGVSGVVLFASLFLPWYRQEPKEGLRDEFTRAIAERAGSTDISAFDAFSAVDIMLVVVAGLGLAICVVTAIQKSPAVGVALEALVTLISGVAVIVVLVRVLNFPDSLAAFNAPSNPFETSRTAWIAVGPLATIGVCVGSVVAMRDERLSKPGKWTDSTGVPIDAPPEVEIISSP
jgi:hypothetical protein